MSHHTFANSRDEIATNRQLTNVEERSRRTSWSSRVAAAACLVAVVATGTAYPSTTAAADTAPAVADQAPANPVVIQNLEANLAALFEKVSTHLDTRVKQQTDAIVQQAAEQQITTLLQRLEARRAMSSEISKRVDRQLIARRN
ncbi:MAG: hypothetical protein VX466_03660 [Myxococcota bacterium]|nr:hypothetical protein [Myxococcota bacterium]